MTHFSDGVQFGSLAGVNTGSPPDGTVCNFVIVPAALSANGIALSQSVPASGVVLLNGATVSLNTGAAVLDFDRRVTVTSAGNDSGLTITVRGADRYGFAVTSTFAGANAGAATTLKTYKVVNSVTFSGASAGAVTVGYSNAFGLPVQAPQAAFVNSVKWSTTLTQDTGTFVAADTTMPATAGTGDVRGVYTPSSVADGVKALVMLIAVDSGNRIATFGVPQV